MHTKLDSSPSRTRLPAALLALLLSSVAQMASAQSYHFGARDALPDMPVVAMELSTPDGKQLLLETPTRARWAMEKGSTYKSVFEIPNPAAYMVVFERLFVVGKYRYIPIERIEKAERKAGANEWMVSYDGGKQLATANLRLALCPAADATPVPERCASAFLQDLGYLLYTSDQPTIQAGAEAEKRLLASGSLRGLSADEARERKAAVQGRLDEVAKQERDRKKAADDQRQRQLADERAGRDQLRLRSLAVLDKAARGGTPTDKLLARMKDMVHTFSYDYADPCHIDTHNGAWSTSNGGLDIRDMDVSGVGNIQIERYDDPYVNGETRRVRYTIFPGSNLRYDFNRQDDAQEGVRILRELRRRCMARG